MNYKFKLAVAALLVCAAQASFGATTYSYQYAMTFPADSPDFTIDNWYVLEASPVESYGLRFPEGFGYGINSLTGGTLDTYPLYSPYIASPASQALLIGLTHDLPGDAEGQEHIVLGMDNTAAGLAQGIGWGTLFTHTLEDDLIFDLHHYIDPDPTVTGAALQGLVDYAYGDATNGILDNEAQSHSAWFDPHGAFSIQSWSDGTILGTGQATEFSHVTPEPMSMGALALGVVAVLRRRKKA